MGVDILGIVSHKMTLKEILLLPKKIDSWDKVKGLKKGDEYMLKKNCQVELQK